MTKNLIFSIVFLFTACGVSKPRLKNTGKIQATDNHNANAKAGPKKEKKETEASTKKAASAAEPQPLEPNAEAVSDIPTNEPNPIETKEEAPADDSGSFSGPDKQMSTNAIARTYPVENPRDFSSGYLMEPARGVFTEATPDATGTRLMGGIIQKTAPPGQGLFIIYPGGSLKLKVLIPPGVSSAAAQVTMNSWYGYGSGQFLYAHSFRSYPQPEDYKPMASTTYSFSYINETGNSLRTSPSEKPMYGYLIFQNKHDKNMRVGAFSYSYIVSNFSLYNKWVKERNDVSKEGSAGG